MGGGGHMYASASLHLSLPPPPGDKGGMDPIFGAGRLSESQSCFAFYNSQFQYVLVLAHKQTYSHSLYSTPRFFFFFRM